MTANKKIRIILDEEGDDAATICGYSDRKAATVIRRTPKTITVCENGADLLNGANSGEPDALNFSPGGFVGHMSGKQRYRYWWDFEGAERKFSLRKDGRWIECGSKKGDRLILGRRDHYYDFNF
jgi:hypothetical protein